MSDPDELKAEWFEFGRKSGKQEERERIYKLLKVWGEDAGCYCCASDAAVADIIEFIEGKTY